MINSDNLCMSCMKEIGSAKQCPHCGFHVDSQQSADYLPIRTVLGNRYLVGKLLEFNGDGATYMGLDLTTRSTINIREYFPLGLAVRQKDTLKVTAAPDKERIFDEYLQSFTEMWRKLHRLNGLSALIKVNDVVEGGGTCYAITENIDGVTLREYLLKNTSAGYVPWEKARTLLMPVLSTLGTLHGSGIIHRGISPSTLIVGSDNKIRISGFSISAVRSAHTDLQAEIFPGYAAFEQYGFDGRQGPWTDIYGFGAVLYRTLIGTDPIDAKERVANDRLMIPGRFAEQLPAYVINGLVNALQILPDDRIRNVEELRDELSASPNAVAATDKKMDIEQIRATQRENPVPKPDSSERIAEAQKRHKKSVVLIVLSTIVIIAVVALVVLFVLSDGSGGRNQTTTQAVSEEMVEVPSFTDNNYDDVVNDKYYSGNFTIEKQEVYSDTKEEGVIIKQSIAPGTQVEKMSKIVLTVSKGVEYISFPSSGVVGANYSDAKTLLESLGFTVSKIEKSNDSGNTKDVVYQASLDGGAVYPKGKQVILTVWGEYVTTTTTTTTTAPPEPDDSGNSDFQSGIADFFLN